MQVRREGEHARGGAQQVGCRGFPPGILSRHIRGEIHGRCKLFLSLLPALSHKQPYPHLLVYEMYASLDLVV